MNLKFLLLFAIFVVRECSSSHVLVLELLGAKSHRMSMMPIVKGLAERGHNITIVSPNLCSESIEGVREIQTNNYFINTEFDWFKMNEDGGNPGKVLGFFSNLINVVFKNVLIDLMANAKFNDLMANEKVDLVIIDDSFNDVGIPLIDKLGAPFIIHSASTGYPWSWNSIGASQEYASIPGRMSRYHNEMVFKERLVNTLITAGLMMFRQYYILPPIDEQVREYFPNARPIAEIEKEASLLFLCSKIETTWPRPLPPTAVPLGALHVRPAQPLPQDFQKFVGESGENGFIIFTLGSVSSSKNMPKKHIDTFLKTFGRLSQQKVIWKWDSDVQPDNVPSNVLLSKWLPQQDLLGQSNARLFITHGGQLGMQEAIYHGVPLLALPFATDQYMNAAKGTKEGCSLKLEWKELDEQKLYDAITTITNQPSFKENAMRLSSIMRDQLVSGKDTAVYWVEHVIRHNGTKHLKMVSQDMPLYQYYLLDVMAFIAAVVLAVTVLFIFVLILVKRLVKRLFCGASKSGSAHLKSQ